MKTPSHPLRSPQVWAWAAYDWANSAFATAVTVGFFPVFFKQHWCAGMASEAATLRLGLGSAATALAVAVAAPVIGAVADGCGCRKRFLAGFGLVGVLATAALYRVAAGDWTAALVVYALATIGFSGANILYDSLLVAVTTPDRFGLVSAFGYALGYLGGGILFAGTVWMVVAPQMFGIADAEIAVRLAFPLVALWWALFSIPLLLLVPERRPDAPTPKPGHGGVTAALRELAATLRAARTMRPVLLFLAAYWFYIDGVNTIARMAVDYGLSLGLGRNGLITALLITQFVSFPAALLYGACGQRVGAKRAILAGLAVYCIITVFAAAMRTTTEFYLLAAAVGLVQGGVPALSRSLYARLIPADRTAEFFGFYNMLGRFAAVLGPASMGLATAATGSHRAGIGFVLILFATGAALLRMVPEPPPDGPPQPENTAPAAD